jgi:hypothetical protein
MPLILAFALALTWYTTHRIEYALLKEQKRKVVILYCALLIEIIMVPTILNYVLVQPSYGIVLSGGFFAIAGFVLRFSMFSDESRRAEQELLFWGKEVVKKNKK